MTGQFRNPFRTAPHPAGRGEEREKFLRFLEQDVILENVILTGLRGAERTAVLDSFRNLALARGWKWSGTDLAGPADMTEESMAKGLLEGLSAAAADRENSARAGTADPGLGRDALLRVYERTPGLVSDKLMSALELAWSALREARSEGIVFACGGARNLLDRAAKEEFPLSVLLDVFQALQKKGCRMLLVLTGPPALFAELAEIRTCSERMFRVVEAGRPSEKGGRKAVPAPPD